MLLLGWARLLVAIVPFGRWSSRLGYAGLEASDPSEPLRLANMVDRAAERLPFRSQCLPRAMALSWLLREEKVRHCVVVAVRPAGQREGEDALHAWVEWSGQKVLGDLPGPWLEMLRLGHANRR